MSDISLAEVMEKYEASKKAVVSWVIENEIQTYCILDKPRAKYEREASVGSWDIRQGVFEVGQRMKLEKNYLEALAVNDSIEISVISGDRYRTVHIKPIITLNTKSVFIESSSLPLEIIPSNFEHSTLVGHTGGWEGFDPDDEKYPEELDIALQAWRAIAQSNDNGEGTVKQRLEAWISNSGYTLNKQQISRIATVCNWDKSRGRK